MKREIKTNVIDVVFIPYFFEGKNNKEDKEGNSLEADPFIETFVRSFPEERGRITVRVLDKFLLVTKEKRKNMEIKFMGCDAAGRIYSTALFSAVAETQFLRDVEQSTHIPFK